MRGDTDRDNCVDTEVHIRYVSRGQKSIKMYYWSRRVPFRGEPTDTQTCITRITYISHPRGDEAEG